jgi:hypothetical protein
MTWKLFLDDLRAPPDQTWVVARSVPAAILYITEYGFPYEMSLDHDLGTGTDAPQLLLWILEELMDEHIHPSALKVKFGVHSANPVGALNLNNLWKHILRYDNIL